MSPRKNRNAPCINGGTIVKSSKRCLQEASLQICTRRSARAMRQWLEQDAWRNHPDFAGRVGRRSLRHGRCVDRHRNSPRGVRSLAPHKHVLLATWFILTLLLLVRIASAHGAERVPGEAAQSNWGLELRHGGQRAHSLALDTSIEAEITGLVARIEVRQRFRNDGSAWSEAIYRFPLPDGAAVDRLLVHAGQRVLQGEIRQQQSARRQYQQARAEGMVAALVEQQRPNQFETRLANIGPGEEITVCLGFLAQVDYRDGTFSLQIPLTFTPRWDAPAAEQSAPAPRLQAAAESADHFLTLAIRLRSGINVASLESRYHDMDIHPALGGYDLFLADPDTRTDRVFELDWKPVFGQRPEAILSTWDGGDAVYAMLMLAPPMQESLAPQPREVVFVIDTSGSMEGLSLREARSALYHGLDQLRPDDHFNLIRFASDSHMLFRQSVVADEVNLVEAMDFIDGLTASGGTDMAPALHDAMSLPAQQGLLRQIVFITDGSVGNEEQLLLQVADDLDEARLFTVSIGSAPNTWFMRKAAAIGRGSHTHIGRLEEVGQRMDSLWGRIDKPAVQDICVDWGMEAEFFPEVIPDLYAGEPLWLFARLPAEPREVRLCGLLDGQPWEETSQTLPGRGSEILATLWARSKIEALQDSRIFGLDEDLIRQQATALALQFGLLTPYTSLVAVDHTTARPAGQGLQSGEVASLLPAGSANVSVSFAPTASGWLAQLLLAAFTLLAATCLLWFCSPSRQTRASGSTPPPDPPRIGAAANGPTRHMLPGLTLARPTYAGGH
jgi:Ca-activated chloride channel family protein